MSMEFESYIDYLKKYKRKPITAKGIPGLDPEKTYIFDIIMAEDNTFNFRFEFSTVGPEAVPDGPLYPDQFDYVYKFGLQNKAPGLMMFSSLSAFENFLKSTLPYATNY